jgi:hypothetical protein
MKTNLIGSLLCLVMLGGSYGCACYIYMLLKVVQLLG